MQQQSGKKPTKNTSTSLAWSTITLLKDHSIMQYAQGEPLHQLEKNLIARLYIISMIHYCTSHHCRPFKEMGSNWWHTVHVKKACPSFEMLLSIKWQVHHTDAFFCWWIPSLIPNWWHHSWKNVHSAQTRLCYFSGFLCYLFTTGHANAFFLHFPVTYKMDEKTPL